MKSLIICFLLGFGYLLPVKGQVVINPQLPTPGVFTKPQLWNLSMINTSGQSFNLRIKITISDKNTNQPVLTGISRYFTVENGARQISYSDVAPVVYQAGSPSYQVDNSPTGFLPVGIFNICYTVDYPHAGGSDVLTEECQTIEVEPISPPQLILPSDSEKVISNRPLFTWTPPMPYQFFSGLGYVLSIVEVSPYQTAQEAMQVNVPVYQASGIYQTQLQYPESVASLDTGKLYAWRVFASNNTVPVSSSEVWSFRVEPARSQADTKTQHTAYLELSHSEESVPVLVPGTLQFIYDNRENQSIINLKFKEISQRGERQLDISTNSLPVKFGKNYLKIDLQKTGMFNQSGNYLLEVAAGEKKMYLKFQFRQP